MGTVKPSSLILIMLVSLLVSTVFGIDHDTQTLIDTVCRQTEDYGFCNKVLGDNIHAEQTDMHGLAQIALSQGTQSVTSTYIESSRLYKTETDPKYKQYLKACGDAYGVIEVFYQDGLGLFAGSQYEKLYAEMRKAPAAQEPCFSVTGQQALTERNREARILIAMGITTAFELTHGQSNVGGYLSPH